MKIDISNTRLEVIGFGSVPASAEESRTMARYILELQKQAPVGVFNIGCETCSDYLVAWTAVGKQLENGAYWLYTAPPLTSTERERLATLERQLEELRDHEPLGYISKRCLDHMRDEEKASDTWPVSAVPRDIHANLRLDVPIYAAPPVVSQPAELYELVAQAWRLIPQGDDLVTATWHSAASVFLRDLTEKAVRHD